MTKVAIWYPGALIVNTGNFQTASRLNTLFHDLGCSPRILSVADSTEEADVLIAIHSEKSIPFVEEFRRACPESKVVIILSGTDIYPDLKENSLENLERADAIVALHSGAADCLPGNLRDKARVIFQSARKNPIRKPLSFCSEDSINVAIASHIRPVKGVLTVVEASRLLPRDSKFHFFHVGGELDESYAKRFRREIADSDRYTWLGEWSQEETINLIDQCDYLVLPSLAEGGAQVIGESIIHDTPVVATSIHGNIGLLGEDYPGYFSTEERGELADLLIRIEDSAEFRRELEEHCHRLKPNFEKEREMKRWFELCVDLGVDMPPGGPSTPR